jgi:IclR family pca regulon transcriptional regulator
MPRASSRSTTVSVDRDSSAPATPPQASSIPLTQIDALSGDSNFMTSFARGLAVVQAFSGRKRPMTISQLSLRTGFSRAAVRRCLYTLVKLGFAGTADSHHFYLCPRILSLGYPYISSMPLSVAAQPVLGQMSDQSLESCWIGKLEGQNVVCVAHANATRLMTVDVRVGGRYPAFCTSMGRVLLANLPQEEEEARIARLEFTRYTDRTVCSPAKFRQVLRLVRRDGFAIVDQELEVGVWALAVPIHRSSGRVLEALGIAALAQRVSTKEMVMRLLPRLQDGARELSLLIEMNAV